MGELLYAALRHDMYATNTHKHMHTHTQVRTLAAWLVKQCRRCGWTGKHTFNQHAPTHPEHLQYAFCTLIFRACFSVLGPILDQDPEQEVLVLKVCSCFVHVVCKCNLLV